MKSKPKNLKNFTSSSLTLFNVNHNQGKKNAKSFKSFSKLIPTKRFSTNTSLSITSTLSSSSSIPPSSSTSPSILSPTSSPLFYSSLVHSKETPPSPSFLGSFFELKEGSDHNIQNELISSSSSISTSTTSTATTTNTNTTGLSTKHSLKPILTPFPKINIATIRTKHELQAAGENSRIIEELAYLRDGMLSNKPFLRRFNAVELTKKLQQEQYRLRILHDPSILFSLKILAEANDKVLIHSFLIILTSISQLKDPSLFTKTSLLPCLIHIHSLLHKLNQNDIESQSFSLLQTLHSFYAPIPLEDTLHLWLHTLHTLSELIPDPLSESLLSLVPIPLVNYVSLHPTLLLLEQLASISKSFSFQLSQSSALCSYLTQLHSPSIASSSSLSSSSASSLHHVTLQLSLHLIQDNPSLVTPFIPLIDLACSYLHSPDTRLLGLEFLFTWVSNLEDDKLHQEENTPMVRNTDSFPFSSPSSSSSTTTIPFTQLKHNQKYHIGSYVFPYLHHEDPVQATLARLILAFCIPCYKLTCPTLLETIQHTFNIFIQALQNKDDVLNYQQVVTKLIKLQQQQEEQQ